MFYFAIIFGVLVLSSGENHDSQCIGMEDFSRLPDWTDCQGYYICHHNSSYQQYCKQGFKYDIVQEMCVKGTCAPCLCDTSTSSPPTTPTSIPSTTNNTFPPPTDPPAWNITSMLWNTTTAIWNTTTPLWNTTILIWNTTTPLGNTSTAVWNTSTPLWNTSTLFWNTTTPLWNTTIPVWNTTTPLWNTSTTVWNTSIPLWITTTPLWNTTIETSPETDHTTPSLSTPIKPSELQDCSENPPGTFLPDPSNCQNYYVCMHDGTASQEKCDYDLWWDQLNKVCDFPANVQCTALETNAEMNSFTM